MPFAKLGSDDFGMATPRYKLIDPDQPMYYHLVSTCVKHAYLCGYDDKSGRDYEHRKAWIKTRIIHLARYFAIEVHAYAVLSNHMHMVVYYDPKACLSWSDEEVARRWTAALPRFTAGQLDSKRTERLRSQIANDPELAQKFRIQLGSVSSFMKLLKQPIALRANTEDGETGSFWEKRFYSGAILDESHLMAALAYVDLNPVKAGITRHIKDSLHTSIHQRLQKVANTEERLEELLGPVVSGLVTSDGERRVNGTLGEYLLLLESVVKGSTDGCRPASSSVVPQPIRAARVDHIDKRQRAYGAPHLLEAWLAERQFRPVELRGG